MTMHTSTPERPASPSSLAVPLVFWVIVIVLGTTAPWNLIEPSMPWWRVDWAPFHRNMPTPRLILDMAINVVLYLPLGYLSRRWIVERHTQMKWLYVLGVAAVLSCGTEFVQILNPVRYPAIADVLMNVTGALIGAWGVVEGQEERHIPFEKTSISAQAGIASSI